MGNISKIKKDFDFFQQKVGKVITIHEIIKYTERSLSSVKINISKKWYFFLEKTDNGYLVKNIIEQLSLDDFVTLYEQKAKTRVDEILKNSISYIDRIFISKFYSIEDVNIENLRNKKEIYFLGENGMGKTILLQSIILSLISKIEDQPDYLLKFFKKDDFKGEIYPENTKIYGYGVSRFFPSEYSPDVYGYSTLFNRNTPLNHPLRWLEKVQLLEFRANKINKHTIKTATDIDFLEAIINIEEKREVKIKQTDKSFIFIERDVELEFEELADGYRTILIWLCDLLSRLVDNQPNVEKIQDFKGVVLIDEIDMLLHPKWEAVIVKKLREKLPNIQWFFTTHSPTLVLGSSNDAVFYKVYKEDRKTRISKPFKKSDFTDYMLNGVVTSPLFGLETASMSETSKIYTGDFLYEAIHEKVKERISQKPKQIKEIKNIIDDVLDEFEKEGKL